MASRRRTPTIRQRRLAGQLRMLRERAQLDRGAAMEALACDESKISRLESAQHGCRLLDLRILLNLYGASPEERDDIEQIWRESRQKGWWDRYKSDIDPSYATYVQIEWDATSLYDVANSVIPGQLQVDRYTDAYLRLQNPTFTEERIQTQLRVKQERKKIFERDKPPMLWAVLAESVLYHEVADSDVMQEQCEALLELTSSDYIELQVLPRHSPVNSLLMGPFVVMGFDHPEQEDVVYQEGSLGAMYYEEESDVRKYSTIFRRIQMEAAGKKSTRALINSAKNEQRNS